MLGMRNGLGDGTERKLRDGGGEARGGSGRAFLPKALGARSASGLLAIGVAYSESL
jgi:hypothetical protein